MVTRFGWSASGGGCARFCFARGRTSPTRPKLANPCPCVCLGTGSRRAGRGTQRGCAVVLAHRAAAQEASAAREAPAASGLALAPLSIGRQPDSNYPKPWSRGGDRPRQPSVSMARSPVRHADQCASMARSPARHVRLGAPVVVYRVPDPTRQASHVNSARVKHRAPSAMHQ